jgi:acyl-CoA dehydrogenase
MNNDDLSMLIEPFRRLLADVSPAEAVRAAEVSPGTPDLWAQIEGSGFLDALLPEDKGGAGLSLDQTFVLVAATGEVMLPVPFAETMVARALLAALAAAATHALVMRNDTIVLIRIDSASMGQDPFGAGGGMVDTDGEALITIERGTVDLSLFAAGLTAAKMAGAMQRMLEMSLRHAEERQQFGRSLGKFQAIQQQLAVMSEQVVSAWVAARIGMAAAHFDPVRVAMAKTRVSEASHLVAAIAHAVHGAIGVTEEYDLQLLTRRLKQWQLAFGSETYWAIRLGRARRLSNIANGADFLRACFHEMETTT